MYVLITYRCFDSGLAIADMCLKLPVWNIVLQIQRILLVSSQTCAPTLQLMFTVQVLVQVSGPETSIGDTRTTIHVGEIPL